MQSLGMSILQNTVPVPETSIIQDASLRKIKSTLRQPTVLRFFHMSIHRTSILPYASPGGPSNLPEVSRRNVGFIGHLATTQQF